MLCNWKLYICDDQGEKIFGRGPMVLLENTDRYKSLNRAAAEMNMSYHKALKIMKSAEDGLGLPLLEKKTGGENGGGSLLTPEARALMEKYTLFEQRAQELLQQLFDDIFAEPG